MTCSPLETYSMVVHSTGPHSLRNGFVVLSPLHRSRLQPDLAVVEGAESSMDMFVPYEAPVERERSRTRKDKHVIVDDDVALGQGSPTDNILRDYLKIQAGGSGGDRIDHNELLDFDFPPTEGGSGKVLEFTKESRMVNGNLLIPAMP
ncbi:hypothetical protein HID58_060101 [Brassica napus]|uniref:Uncharacterized protein n=1 Tax=Brassica napus TaxID=3708 RepID=A0ABQ7ZVT2_BRANA|nr:hypothetical protein HID58_060101 [Brassica napus]